MLALNFLADQLWAGNLIVWSVFTLWNFALLASLGLNLVKIYDDARDKARLRRWRRKYGYGVVAESDPKADTRQRMSEFARELKVLCERTSLNLEGVNGIVVTDRTLYAGHYWHAVFSGCDFRGVYNTVNAGWFE